MGVCRCGVVDEAARRVLERGHALRELRPLPELEHELAARGAQRLVDPGEHPAQPGGPVRREQLQPRWVVAGAELGQRSVERLLADHHALRVVELTEARVEPGCERVSLQQAKAEAVDGRDPRAVELAGEVGPPALVQGRADAGAELGRRLARVGDDEQRVDVEPVVAHRADEPLDEDRRLAGAGARRDEDLASGLDRRDLLRIELRHARLIRHIRHSEHQLGHSPPFGSWRTSPRRIRCASSPAFTFAPSTCSQNASSSR